MEPNEFNMPLRARPKHRLGMDDDGQKIPLALFLHANSLNEFQKKVLPLFLAADHTETDVARALPIIDEYVSVLHASHWAPKRPDHNGDMVDRPDHYAQFTIEPFLYAMENQLDPCRFNALKYICRYRLKNGIEDLKKAKRCLVMYLGFMNGDPGWSK